MTPRECVLRTLSREPVARPPFSWGFGPTSEMASVLEETLAPLGLSWSRLFAACGDLLAVSLGYTGHIPCGGGLLEALWGIKQTAIAYEGGTYEEFTGHPLADADSVASIEAYPWPDAVRHDFAGFRETALAADPDRRKALVLAGGNPLEIYTWMAGFERALLNVAANPEVVLAAMDRITDFFERRLAGALQAGGEVVDIVFLADDLGGQFGPLLSREMYRRLVQPFHARLTAVVRRHAPHAKVMYHTDGGVFPLIPDLLDAGVDILEAVQIEAAGMDPTALKAAYGNRLCFHGGISVQQVLPRLAPGQVADACGDLIAVLGQGGGYIPAPSHAIQVGTPVENVLAMLEAILGEEDYRSALEKASVTGLA